MTQNTTRQSGPSGPRAKNLRPDFGPQVRKHREAVGLPTGRASEIIGHHPSYLSGIETKNAGCAEEVPAQLAALFGVPLSEFVIVEEAKAAEAARVSVTISSPGLFEEQTFAVEPLRALKMISVLRGDVPIRASDNGSGYAAATAPEARGGPMRDKEVKSLAQALWEMLGRGAAPGAVLEDDRIDTAVQACASVHNLSAKSVLRLLYGEAYSQTSGFTPADERARDDDGCLRTSDLGHYMNRYADGSLKPRASCLIADGRQQRLDNINIANKAKYAGRKEAH